MVTALYLAAAALLRGLPDAVAVPGTQRGKAEGVPAPSSAGTPLERLRDYLRANWEGLCYVKSRRGIPSLILFETLFWTTGVAFYILLEWQATGTLFLDHRGHQLYFGYALGSAGAGLFAGAILSGRISRHVSPLFTYPPAVFLIGLGMAQVLGARGAWSPLADSAALEANFALALELLPWAGLMGFGGGLLMGRIDADLLAVAEASMRGRVFSIKGFFFTGALLLPLLLFLFDLPDDVFLGLAHHLPRGLMWAALAVLPLSWFLDCGIYAGRTGKPIVGVQERLFYRFARLIAWLISKLYFRMTVVGLERIPKEGPVLLAANHGSFLDPFWAGCALPRVIKYIMHASYYNSLAHPFFRLLMTIPVDTSSNIRALKAGTEALKEGYCVVMFPEGHVSDDGKLQKPKAGVLFLAQRAGAPVIPVAIQGNTRAYPRWFKIPRPRKITLLIGEPFSVPKDASRREVAELTDRLMRTLAEMLNLEPPPACVDDVPERGKAGEAQP
ncbi:MAG: 1-acyl-sn-glycerol-3-phosphate acyltransferase [Planctomycetota bacterium]|nr:1-acyl-sn-glycerol-3-phosphate acyltransferase [Planctomycetota bacterium]